MHQHVAVIGQDPLTLVVAFQTHRQLARQAFELQGDFVGDGLNLPLIGAAAEDEIIGEGSDAGQIQNLDVGGLLGFGGADRYEPGCGGGRKGGGCFKMRLGQNTLLLVSYYAG